MSRVARSGWIALFVAAVVLIYGARELASPAPDGTAADASAVRAEGDVALILSAFADRRSGIWVEAAGAVERMLPDDNEGSRHQRFILRLAGADGHTVLVSHNIDLADRLPLRTGDVVGFRGMYEWNDRGGVVHWTHHDPENRHAGGWLRVGDLVYR